MLSFNIILTESKSSHYVQYPVRYPDGHFGVIMMDKEPGSLRKPLCTTSDARESWVDLMKSNPKYYYNVGEEPSFGGKGKPIPFDAESMKAWKKYVSSREHEWDAYVKAKTGKSDETPKKNVEEIKKDDGSKAEAANALKNSQKENESNFMSQPVNSSTAVPEGEADSLWSYVENNPGSSALIGLGVIGALGAGGTLLHNNKKAIKDKFEKLKLKIKKMF